MSNIWLKIITRRRQNKKSLNIFHIRKLLFSKKRCHDLIVHLTLRWIKVIMRLNWRGKEYVKKTYVRPKLNWCRTKRSKKIYATKNYMAHSQKKNRRGCFNHACVFSNLICINFIEKMVFRKLSLRYDY